MVHAVGPSALRSPREPTLPRPLTAGELDAIVEGFRASAVNAVAAGFEVVELHAAHGSLLAQFLSAVTNHRPGAESLGGQLALVARITREIRSAAPQAVLGIRLSIDGAAQPAPIPYPFRIRARLALLTELSNTPLAGISAGCGRPPSQAVKWPKSQSAVN